MGTLLTFLSNHPGTEMNVNLLAGICCKSIFVCLENHSSACKTNEYALCHHVISLKESLCEYIKMQF